MKRDYLSASALKAFMKSPNHYIQYVTKKREQTPALLLGSAAHCLFLEPDTFDSRYAVAPIADRRTKAGKEVYNAFLSSSEGKEVLTQDLYEQARAIATATFNDEVALRLITSEGAQVERQLKQELFGFSFVGYIDLETAGGVYDLKTTKDASPESFQKEAYNYGYHIQGAIYRQATGKPFYWIAVEKEAPHNVVIYKQSDDAYHRTCALIQNAVDRFKAWDGKPEGYQLQPGYILDLPRWA